MFGIDSSELLLIVIVTIVVVGPKELPRVLYKIGQVMGKIRGLTQHFRTGIDAMVREVEMEELEKKWALDNQRIMAEHPEFADAAGVPPPAEDVAAAGETPSAEPVPSWDDAPVHKFETPDYVVDVESLDDDHKPPRPEAAA